MEFSPRTPAALALTALLACACSGPSDQPDAARVADVHGLAALVEEYHAKTGQYPLAERAKGRFVRVALAADKASAGAEPGAVLAEALRQGLGRDISLPRDPDPARGGDLGYQYGADAKHYSVAAFLQAPNDYTRQIGEQMHLYEVGSADLSQYKIWNYRKMIAGEYRSP